MNRAKITVVIAAMLVAALKYPSVTAAGLLVVPIKGQCKAEGDAVAADVLEGKTFSNVDATNIAGTMPDNGAVTITPSASGQSIAAGYHNGSGAVAGDADLVSGNIKSGVTIFGVTGSYFGSSTCSGTLNGTRWCDNGNGTVTDMTTGLVWLQNANCFAPKVWIDTANWDDAQTASGALASGACGLTDGSLAGDWRLPTFKEFKVLTIGNEAVLVGTPRAFIGVQSNGYWSSSTINTSPNMAWASELGSGFEFQQVKTASFFVWPVRSGQ